MNGPKVKCVDFQILKLQEAPDSVPHGEMPRHLQLFADRFLVDRVVPGNRVTVLGIYSIKKANMDKAKKRSKKKALDGLEEVDEENLEDDGGGDDRTYESEYGNDGTVSDDDGSLITTISIQTEDIGEVNEAQERLTKFLDDMAFTANRDNYEEDDGEDETLQIKFSEPVSSILR